MTKFTCFRGFLPSIFSAAAIVLGTAANTFCENVMFRQKSGNDDLVIFVGPWSYRAPYSPEWGGSTLVYSTCRSYSYLEEYQGFDYTIDAKTRTVQAFSIITPLVGGLLLILTCCGTCGKSLSKSWKIIGYLLFLTSALQGITLLIENSSICYDNPVIQYLEAKNSDLAGTFPSECKWAGGFKINVAAVLLWAVAGACCLLLPPPLVIHERPRQEQTVTYTQGPDGKVQETHVAVVKGTPVEP